jgi:2-oxoglutarate ferredoxin oxidoreductase subunit beta
MTVSEQIIQPAANLHPIDNLLRADRFPHILCPGCGIGTVIHGYAHAIAASEIPEDQHVCVSGIGCSGRAAGYVNVDSYHTTHGRALPFALGIAVHNPKLNVTVISGDGDLTAIGGNHLIHAARRNVNLNVICINNFNYGMTGGQVGPTTPIGAKGSTAPTGAVEQPFNLPYTARARVSSCGVAVHAKKRLLFYRGARTVPDEFRQVEQYRRRTARSGHLSREVSHR